MHRWLQKLLVAYHPAARCRALVEGWPVPITKPLREAQQSLPLSRSRERRPQAERVALG